MTNPQELYNLRAIHELLVAAFDTASLRRFCQFHDLFQPILAEFGPGDSFNEMVSRAISYCQRHRLLAELLAAVEAENSALYRLFRDRLPTPAPQPSPGPPPAGELSAPGALPPGSRLPFQRNALFTGRTGPLLALARALLYESQAAAALVSQAVQGLGGVGKSQLTIEFAYRYGRYFRGVHWLDAARPEGLPAEVAACGRAMGLQPWPRELPEQVRATLAAWRGDGPRLVILDNLEAVEAARQWLPRLTSGGVPRLAGGGVRLLLTARRRDWPRDLGLRPLRLALFRPAESLAFLRQYLPDERAGDEELAGLASHLGHLPLALELASRYLEAHRRLDAATYRARLKGALDHPSLAGWREELGSPTGHDLDLAATFALSWEREDLTPAGRRLFRMAGYCAPNRPIPCELLEAAAGLDEAGCDEALARLAGLGLVEWDDPPAGPALHPLLARYARALPNEPGEDAPLPALAGALARLARAANAEVDRTGDLAHFVPLLPHLPPVAGAAEEEELEEAGGLWNELGYHLDKVADYAGARAAYERALAILQQFLPADHPKIRIARENLDSLPDRP